MTQPQDLERFSATRLYLVVVALAFLGARRSQNPGAQRASSPARRSLQRE